MKILAKSYGQIGLSGIEGPDNFDISKKQENRKKSYKDNEENLKAILISPLEKKQKSKLNIEKNLKFRKEIRRKIKKSDYIKLKNNYVKVYV